MHAHSEHLPNPLQVLAAEAVGDIDSDQPEYVNVLLVQLMTVKLDQVAFIPIFKMLVPPTNSIFSARTTNGAPKYTQI